MPRKNASDAASRKNASGAVPREKTSDAVPRENASDAASRKPSFQPTNGAPLPTPRQPIVHRHRWQRVPIAGPMSVSTKRRPFHVASNRTRFVVRTKFAVRTMTVVRTRFAVRTMTVVRTQFANRMLIADRTKFADRLRKFLREFRFSSSSSFSYYTLADYLLLVLAHACRFLPYRWTALARTHST